MQRGDPMELNFEVLEMQKWSIRTDRAQMAEEKNGVIFLFIMFTPRVMVIKMSKTTFFAFLANESKNQSQFWENIYVHLKDLV